MKTTALFVALAAGCNFNHWNPSQQEQTPSCPPTSTVTLPMPTGPQAFGGEENQAAVPPPPISGGTLAVFPRGEETYAVASVPETDRITVIHLTGTPGVMGQGSLFITSRELALDAHDEPGRIVEDGAGRVHVVLRGAGSILTFDPVTLAMSARRSVCPAPRGIAYEPSIDALEVVCATGELVTLPAAGGEPTQRVFVDRDLRDVVSLGDRLLVTRLRSAELLTVSMTGTITNRITLPARDGRTPHVAWRMTRTLGKVAISYELASNAPIDVRKTTVQRSQYGGAPTMTSNDPPGPVVVAAIAVTMDGSSFQLVDSPMLAPVFDVAIDTDATVAFYGGAMTNGTIPIVPTTAKSTPASVQITGRQVPAVAFGIHGTTTPIRMLFAQSRQPAAINVYARLDIDNSYTMMGGVPLSGVSDTGFDMFHTPTPAGVACASCHPEGGDDGHTWKFTTHDLAGNGTCPTPGLDAAAPAVPRRTQSLRGGILSTAPLHWDGDMSGMGDILDEVFTRRMNGGVVTPGQRAIFQRWIDSIPRMPQRTDLDAARVDSGRTLFEGKGGCASCHSGAKLTNNGTVDVGRGALQVPMLLGVGARAPFLHDGCAATLMGRFDPTCGGSAHGNALTFTEQSDVVQYLESL